MRPFIRANVLTVTIGLLALLYAGVGAFAAPEATPWPDPFESAGVMTQEDTPVDVPTDAPADLPSDPPADLPNGEEDGGDVLQQNGEGDPGVPLDSPACAGTMEDPNPHDTDGDGDGCREVETPDGMKNLPDPAADAHEGNPGNIGRGDENGNGPPDPLPGGPPEGAPFGDDQQEVEDTDNGGPPNGIPGRPEGLPNVPPASNQP
jgi:hypothetical protein